MALTPEPGSTTWFVYNVTPGSLEEFEVLGLPLIIPLEIPAFPPGVTIPAMPPIGVDGIDYGIEVNFTCPGWPACKRLEGACTYTVKTGVSLDPTKFIPGIPAIPVFNTTWFKGYKKNIQVPPDIYNPLKCPNNPKKV